MTEPTVHAAEGDERCPDCGMPLPVVKITKATVPVEMIVFCTYCPCGAARRANWAEHFDGEILSFPKIELGNQSDQTPGDKP